VYIQIRKVDNGYKLRITDADLSICDRVYRSIDEIEMLEYIGQHLLKRKIKVGEQ
jgi:hypothetical protein